MVGIELNYLFDVGDSIPLYMVLACFALVFGLIDIVVTAIHLAPTVWVTWNNMMVNHIPAVLAELGQVGRTIFGSLVCNRHPLLSSFSHISFSAHYLIAQC